MMGVKFFKHGNKTVALEGLRCIEEIRSNPAGGAPHRDCGVIRYDDNNTIETSLEFAHALAEFVTAQPESQGTKTMTEDLTKYDPEKLPEWQRWKGEGEPPRRWKVTNPKTGEKVIVYRSYADYVEG